MQHWTMRQFNARYIELSTLAHATRLQMYKEAGSRRIETLRTLAALDLMMADAFDAASLSGAVSCSLFEVAAYSRAARERRTSAREWRTLADQRQART